MPGGRCHALLIVGLLLLLVPGGPAEAVNPQTLTMPGVVCFALLIVVLLLLLVPGGPAEALNPETLLMPGKLSAAHVKYEEQCSLCHDRTDRRSQTQLCLDCHKEIAGDLKQRHGFHGHFPGIDVSQCNACHSEHLGREADIVKLSL